MGFWRLIAGTDLEHQFAKLFAEVTLKHVALLCCVNLSEIFVLIFMWSAITTASESLANFAVQHPNYLGAVILPVLGKSSEVCPQCFTGRRTVIVHTLNLTDSAQLH